MVDGRSTEAPGALDDLDQLAVADLVAAIAQADAEVPLAVANAQPAIVAFLEALEPRMRAGGRLFYLGAGTSGRLGILDASELPPTYGVPPDRVVGLIAGGDGAIRTAVEGAEDDTRQGWADLLGHGIAPADSVVGLSASGTTPYVLGALQAARAAGCLTACITCNSGTPIAQAAEYPIEVVVGPEVIRGSTRMKAGTAQKLVLNQISTTLMVRLGHVQGNRMVDMRLSNAKLIERGTRFVQEMTGLPADQARALLLRMGSVRNAVAAWQHER